jgi:3-methyl-2-oxobutanoate hydroxymethyltransferase
VAPSVTRSIYSAVTCWGPTRHFTRQAKKYADLAAEESRLQKIRVAALMASAEDVKSGRYPERNHEVRVAKETFKQFLALIGGSNLNH